MSNRLDTACSRFGLFKHRHGVVCEGDLACFAGVASNLVEAAVAKDRRDLLLSAARFGQRREALPLIEKIGFVSRGLFTNQAKQLAMALCLASGASAQVGPYIDSLAAGSTGEVALRSFDPDTRARNRYALFGKGDMCAIPDPAFRARLIG